MSPHVLFQLFDQISPGATDFDLEFLQAKLRDGDLNQPASIMCKSLKGIVKICANERSLGLNCHLKLKFCVRAHHFFNNFKFFKVKKLLMSFF